MTTIYLVSSGQTDYSEKKIIQGQKNTHLNNNGVHHVKKLRQKIKNLSLDICYTSPLFRTLETAFGLVGDKVYIIKDERLIARNMGQLTEEALSSFDKEKYLDLKVNSSDLNVESISRVVKRCQLFVQDILTDYKEKNVLIVTHSSILPILQNILVKNNKILLKDVPNCHFEKIMY